MKRLADKPFVLLGVNSDSDRDAIRKTVKDENLTWRSWWDDGSTLGPIQAKWQVAQRPVVYVLDAQGVIRYRNIISVNEELLDETIDALLEELGAETGKP